MAGIFLEETLTSETAREGAHGVAPTRNGARGGDVYEEQVETFRYANADNPGLIEDASDNVGPGHSFLWSMERSLALVYTVDISGPAPWDELRMPERSWKSIQWVEQAGYC
jgi:GTP-binding protein